MDNNLDFSHLHVEFFMDTKENKRKTEQMGRPIFNDVEKVRIRMAGDRHTEFVAPAHDVSSVRGISGHRLTYAQLHRGPYDAFRENVAYHGNGTPLSELPFLTKSQVKELQAINIHNAETLANIDGEALKLVGNGARKLKNQAKAYLENAATTHAVADYAEANEAMKAELNELKAVVAGLKGDPVKEVDISASPFKDWQKEDIANWIADNGGAKPHHKTGHDKVVALADALNAKLANEAA